MLQTAGEEPPAAVPDAPSFLQRGTLFFFFFFFFITLGLELSDTSLKYEPSLELLLNTALHPAPTAGERGGKKLNVLEDLNLKAEARIWP